MTSLLQPCASAQLITAIARMLGKAVKFRHCPATVSAPAFACRRITRQEPDRISAQACSALSGSAIKPLKSKPFGSALGRRLNRAQVRRPVLGAPNRFHVPRGTKELTCRLPISCAQLPAAPCFGRSPCSSLLNCAVVCPAASIRGVVTDATGAKVTGASISLISNGQVIASAVSTADGSFQILTGAAGRFFLVVSAKSFRQLQTPDFYAGQFDSIERNVVLEPAWVRESIVVTATGTPTPQPQTSAATTVLGPLDLALRDDLVSALRLMPGAFVVQDRPAWRAILALRPRRRLRRQQDPPRRRRCRRPGQSIRFRLALHHGGRERGSLSRAGFQPLRRGR